MLYDPKWEAPTKADPLSLDSLIAWLEKQPADESYDFCKADTCLVTQYLSTIFKNVEPIYGDFDAPSSVAYVIDGQAMFLPQFEAVVHASCDHGQWTFGAALSRARTLRAARSE